MAKINSMYIQEQHYFDMDKILEKFNEKLGLNYSTKDFCAYLGMTQATYYNYRKGKIPQTVPMLVKSIQQAGLTIEDVLLPLEEQK